MLGNAPKSKYTSVPGWETEAEEEKLIELARQYVPNENGIIVELGVEFGRSTAEFAYAVKDKRNTKIISVDLFPDDHPYAKDHGGLLAVWRANLREYGAENSENVYLLPMRGKSYDIGAKWSGEEIDLLFIDAAHDYLSVKSDIAAWVNFVKPGGVVAFHDVWKNDQSHPVHIEVKKAVDEWQFEADQKWERYDAPDSLVYFVKPNGGHAEKVVIKDGTLPTGASYSKTTGAPGWLTEQEEKKLIEIARLFVPENGVIVELGGGLGRSAAAFGIASKNKRQVTITTVDLFDEGSFSQRLPFNQKEAWENNIKEAMQNAAIEYSFSPSKTGVNFFCLQQNSQLLTDYAGEIDLLFIDADHDYESVIADIKAWSPYVKQGGLMVFHDYHRGEYKNVFHGVVAAVNEWREIYKADWLELDAPGSLAVFKRQTANDQPKTVESGVSIDKTEKKTRKPREKKEATTPKHTRKVK